jgi:hypothetical protein
LISIVLVLLLTSGLSRSRTPGRAVPALGFGFQQRATKCNIAAVTDLAPTAQEIIDSEHLRVLTIVHFVLGGLHALMSCLLIFHFVFGLILAVGSQIHGQGQLPPTIMGLFMSAFAGCFMILGWLFGGLTVYSGICIKNRRHRIFSFVMAAVNCLSIPFGTALGIFTILVLSRESVKRLYVSPPLTSK